MPHCHALTVDLKRCRAYATMNDTGYDFTCAAHRDYFTSPPGGPHPFRIVQGIPNRVLNDLVREPSICIFLEDALKNGLITITKKDIEKINVPIYNHFLLICAKHIKDFHINWNINVSKSAIRYIMWKIGSIGPVTYTYQDIFAFIRNDPVPGFWFVLEETRSRTKVEWYEFFEACVKEDWFGEFILTNHSSHIAAILKKNPSPMVRYILEEEFEFKKWFNQQRYAMRVRLGPLKESIIAYGWETWRFVRWCLDEGEKNDMRAAWPDIDPNERVYAKQKREILSEICRLGKN